MAEFEFLFYRGLGSVSRLIQLQTRSVYSHVAIRCRGVIYEAWHTGGDWPWSGRVRRIGHPLDRHDPRTPIDIYRFDNPADFDIGKAELYLKSQLGKGYDYLSVLRFVSRREAPHNDRLFCSEYGMESGLAGGRIMLHCSPAKVSPGVLSMSPEISYCETFNGKPHPTILHDINSYRL